ncbi:MAG: Gfo/Idh/MocA family oxidoreductase [Pirellulaceae bacterium]
MRIVVFLLLCCVLPLPLETKGAEPKDPAEIRLGIIGLDTSHVTAFTKSFNAEPALPEMQNCRVVAAYPHGSREIESSYSRIPKYTEELRDLDVEIVDSIDALLAKVDGVLLETNDGTLHLEQALKVFQAGKPVFIDKPAGAQLSEVVAIYRAAKHYNVPMFSSSSLRYSKGAQEIRDGKIGDVHGCSAYSPCSLEPSHSRLFWYGIHGVELLFTCMGSGCDSVSMTITDDADVAVGRWSDGRIGVFRGIRKGKAGYGGMAFGSKAIADIGKYDGYQPLAIEIAKFFRTQQVPIDANETINLYAFMAAAEQSVANGGASVSIAAVMENANSEADELLSGQLR